MTDPEYTRFRNPRRRHSDLTALKVLRWCGTHYNDIWLVIISAMLVWIASAALNGGDIARRSADTAKRVAAQFAMVAQQAKEAAVVAQMNSDLAKDLAKAIQAQRESLTRANCDAQNKHHDDTLREIDRQFTAAIQQVHDPGRKLQLRASRTATEIIINKLVPHQDCAAAVRRVQVKPIP